MLWHKNSIRRAQTKVPALSRVPLSLQSLSNHRVFNSSLSCTHCSRHRISRFETQMLYSARACSATRRCRQGPLHLLDALGHAVGFRVWCMHDCAYVPRHSPDIIAHRNLRILMACGVCGQVPQKGFVCVHQGLYVWHLFDSTALQNWVREFVITLDE